jgi:hypothetical protein
MMSEYKNTPPQPESFLDPAIAGILTEYEAQLPDAEKAVFRGLADQGKRVFSACWELAKRPETFSRAVNLRSLHAVRLIDVKSSTLPEAEEWPYHIGNMDTFWQNVDLGIKAYLQKYGYPIPDAAVHETINEHGIYVGEGLIAEMHGRYVARLTVRDPAYETPNHVTYLITKLIQETD